MGKQCSSALENKPLFINLYIRVFINYDSYFYNNFMLNDMIDLVGKYLLDC